MTKYFRGRFEGRLDSKGRLIIPAKYRQSFLGLSSGDEFVVTNSQSQGKRCLDIYPIEEWEALEAKIDQLPSFKAEVQAFKRFYLAAGIPVKIDAQNRILLPQNLRQFAELGDELVCVGMGSKFEVWEKSAWESLQEDLGARFEDIMAAVAQMEAG